MSLHLSSVTLATLSLPDFLIPFINLGTYFSFSNLWVLWFVITKPLYFSELVGYGVLPSFLRTRLAVRVFL